ncbi:TRAP transporter substrate-binding protein DctP [Lysinibacillus sp. LZ02]|uniref:TRAP transporter substrate-binding protein DctP n=1 Tax=Lysinibacillus sp. LZ02 TaxID=3420668 RepID=UPI003D36187A
MKRLSKSFFGLLFTLALVLVLAACGNSESSDEKISTGNAEGGDEETYVIKVGHIAPEDHAFSKGLEEFTAAVEEATEGRVEFEVFGNGALGGEVEVAEQVQLGALDMTLVTSGPVGNFVSDFSVLEMPFLFRDVEHVYATLDGEVGQELMGKLDAAGFKALGIWENGMRHIASNKAIKSPEDMKGLKIRTLENPIYIDMYSSLGADPTPIAFPELYTSLQQGVVDSTDLSYAIMNTSKFYEVTDHFSEVGIYYASAPLLMNGDKFNSLPADIQQILVEKGQEYAVRQREISQEMEVDHIQALKDHGVTIVPIDEIDLEAFKASVEPVYEKYASNFGDLVERIQAVE